MGRFGRSGRNGTTGSGIPCAISGAAARRRAGPRLPAVRVERSVRQPRGPWASINFVTAHDGFTLRDLVVLRGQAQRGERREEPGRHRRQPVGELRRRGRDRRSGDPAAAAAAGPEHAATLLLSPVPRCWSMGDEMWRTQRGNNNAYCQDNATSWVDWRGRRRGSADMLETAAAACCFLAARLRARRRRCGRASSSRAGRRAAATASATWSGSARRRPMTDADWFDGARRTLQMWIDGRDVRGTPRAAPMTDDSWLLVLHAGAEPVELTLPGPRLRRGLHAGAGHRGRRPVNRPTRAAVRRRRAHRAGPAARYCAATGLAVHGCASADRGSERWCRPQPTCRRTRRQAVAVTRPNSAGEASRACWAAPARCSRTGRTGQRHCAS